MLIQPPKNFQYNSSTQKLSWDGVTGAIEYEILYKPDTPIGQWDIAYKGGIHTSCPFDKPPGLYKVKGKTQGTGGWGDYCPEEIVAVGPS